MSQLTAVRTASRTVAGTQWWHLTLSPGGFDVADGIVGALVTPLVAQAEALGAKRWYFTRDEDQARRAQVNLHIQAHPRILERLRALNRPLQEQSALAFPQLLVHQHYSSAVGDSFIPGLGVVDAHLEANLVKYGGAVGLDLAEEVFELSSELSLWAGQRFVKMQSRSALGALILFDSAHSLMHGPHAAGRPERRRITWDLYWDLHLRTCTTDVGPRADAVREAMTRQVAAKATGFHARMAATASESEVRNWRRRWFRCLDTYLHRAEKARVSRTAQHLTVHHAHMTLNRLGFVPREEAALGLFARTCHPELAIKGGSRSSM
ncbi:lantibiotic dehydratase C-terminal domain-containing protein [Arthrobacter sp. Br18]|uniref:lantibiotic dehydratase C-terminal domain-containing protein n=1 Tax=Arthrobacter sp. Br18 TaxID=1312954 RepID=UPI0004786F94|nr:lantibiotic dehydratase C-terminal domain-containing protein [Arthrobacter sp. Br18]